MFLDGRLLVSLCASLCLTACAISPPEHTSIPVVDAQQPGDIQTAIHAGDVVFVTTKTDATGACQYLKVHVNTMDDTRLYGEDDQSRAVTLHFEDIASLEIYRIPRPEADAGPQWGLPVPDKGNIHNIRDFVGYLTVDLVVIAVQVPYYGIKYTYKAVQKQLADTDRGLIRGAGTAPTCARIDAHR